MPTPYLMHTARRSHPQARSFMFIQSPSLTHLFPSSQAPPVCLLLSHTLLSPRSPRGWEDPSPGPCNQALPQGCTATADLTPRCFIEERAQRECTGGALIGSPLWGPSLSSPCTQVEGGVYTTQFYLRDYPSSNQNLHPPQLIPKGHGVEMRRAGRSRRGSW